MRHAILIHLMHSTAFGARRLKFCCIRMQETNAPDTLNHSKHVRSIFITKLLIANVLIHVQLCMYL